VAEKERMVIHRDLAKKQLVRNELLRKQNANALQDFEIIEAEDSLILAIWIL